jgi:hypothetical protein
MHFPFVYLPIYTPVPARVSICSLGVSSPLTYRKRPYVVCKSVSSVLCVILPVPFLYQIDSLVQFPGGFSLLSVCMKSFSKR